MNAILSENRANFLAKAAKYKIDSAGKYSSLNNAPVWTVPVALLIFRYDYVGVNNKPYHLMPVIGKVWQEAEWFFAHIWFAINAEVYKRLTK